MSLHVGTAGFVYQHWRKGAFYPAGLKLDKELPHYLRHHATVEINATWHHFPKHTTLARWRASAHTHTLYALKAPKLITHDNRLADSEHAIISFFRNASRALGAHMGPILFQCPPSLHLSLPLLEHFLSDVARARDACTTNVRVALELRHASWFCTDVYRLLQAHDVALVNNVVLRDDDFSRLDDHALPRARDMPHDLRVGWSYNRFHGSKNAGVFTDFPDSVLRRFAAIAAAEIGAGRQYYAFFLNDLHALAPKNVRRFTELVAERRGVSVKECLGGFAPLWTKEKPISSFFGKKVKELSSPSTPAGKTKASSSAAVGNAVSPLSSPTGSSKSGQLLFRRSPNITSATADIASQGSAGSASPGKAMLIKRKPRPTLAQIRKLCDTLDKNPSLKPKSPIQKPQSGKRNPNKITSYFAPK